MAATYFAIFLQLLTFSALMIGSVLNGMVLWLVHHHTPSDMKPYAKLLRQTSLVDLVALYTSFLLMPVVIQDAEVSTVLYLGPLGQVLPFTVGFICHGFWQLFMNVSISQFCAQFICRWLAIILKWKMPDLLYLFLLFCNPTIATVLNLLVNAPSPDPFRWRNPALPEALGYPNASFARRSLLTPLYQYNNYGVMVWHVFDLIVSVACALWISRHVMRTYQGPNKAQRRDLNRQMNRSMFIQAILPVPFIFLPVGCVTMLRVVDASVITPITSAQIGSLSLECLYWSAAINPLVTLLTIKTYRHQLGRMIRKIFGLKTSVVVLPMAATIVVAGQRL